MLKESRKVISMDTILSNLSKSQVIEISLGIVELKNINMPNSEDSLFLQPGETKMVHPNFDCGTVKMTVWSRDRKMIWCGAIPLGSQSPIQIDPENRKVITSDGVLPSCPEMDGLVENFQGEKQRKSGTNPDTLFWIFVLILLLYLGWKFLF